jgi:hypothetical protein
MARTISRDQSPKLTVSEREILLGENLFKIPERLLLAHARGEVLFITGAGTSMPVLPDFRQLVLSVDEQIDSTTHEVLKAIPADATDNWQSDSNLNDEQRAEVRRFIRSDYDVVLGILEPRVDPEGARTTKVRTAVTEVLRSRSTKYLHIHTQGARGIPTIALR